jgi:radical SAM superfamily enzyme YgiQ (UPF0313 family)
MIIWYEVFILGLETGKRRKNELPKGKKTQVSELSPSIKKGVELYKLNLSINYPEKFNILLIKTAIEHPINDEDFGVPIGLYVLKDYLTTTGHNLEVDVWDERLELKQKPEEARKQLKRDNTLFLKKINEKKYDAVGIGICTSEVLPALEKFHIIREKEPETITFCGGIFTTSNEKCLLETGWIDYVIPGIATKPLGDLLVRLYQQKKRTSGKIDIDAIDVYNVATKKNIHSFRSAWTCSQLPTMQLGMWSEIIRQYYGDDFKKKIGIYTARGCDRECLFCSVQKESKQTIFRRSDSCVIDEIKYLINKGYTYFSFKDEDFLEDEARMFNILNEVKKEKVQFKIRTRYDNLSALIEKNKDFMIKLKNIGIDEIQYGIETFDKNIRETVRKNYYDADDEKKLIDFIKQHADFDIVANCSFILGLDRENTVYYEKLIDFINKIYDSKKSTKPKIYLNFLTPHPYNSQFSVGNHYTLVTNNLNYFTHRFPVCYAGDHDRQCNIKMLETHDKIAENTNSKAYNPPLEDDELYDAFIDCKKIENKKLDLLEIHNEYILKVKK